LELTFDSGPQKTWSDAQSSFEFVRNVPFVLFGRPVRLEASTRRLHVQIMEMRILHHPTSQPTTKGSRNKFQSNIQLSALSQVEIRKDLTGINHLENLITFNPASIHDHLTNKNKDESRYLKYLTEDTHFPEVFEVSLLIFGGNNGNSFVIFDESRTKVISLKQALDGIPFSCWQFQTFR